MPKPYSADLRERGVEAVESGALRREVAEIFKLGVSSVIRWCRRWTETGSADAESTSHFTIVLSRKNVQNKADPCSTAKIIHAALWWS
jgi:transposase